MEFEKELLNRLDLFKVCPVNPENNRLCLSVDDRSILLDKEYQIKDVYIFPMYRRNAPVEYTELHGILQKLQSDMQYHMFVKRSFAIAYEGQPAFYCCTVNYSHSGDIGIKVLQFPDRLLIYRPLIFT